MERRLILTGAAGLGALALLAPLAGWSDPPQTVAAALNKAGRQRMLVQRAAKAWLLLGLGVLPAQARTLLAESIALFDAQLDELRRFLPNDAVGPALARLGQEWERCRALLAMPPTRPLALELYVAGELAQDAAHQLTLTYEKSARTAAERRVNVAGRQRMLSQRLAKFYLFEAWDINRGAARMELNWARAEFSSGMHQLYSAATEIPGLRAPLAELDRQWIAYRDALAPAPGRAAVGEARGRGRAQRKGPGNGGAAGNPVRTARGSRGRLSSPYRPRT